jgi:hypothetical protein
MTADGVYQLILYAAAKNLQQGYVAPDEFNNVLMPMAQDGYCDYLLGEYQKFQLQRPIAPVQFGQTERIRQSLAPLIYGTVLAPNTTTGIAPFPSDYEEVDNMWGQYGFYNIRFIQQPRLQSFYRSTIDPIQQNPVYLLRQEGFQFYPENIGYATLSYVRKPPPIHWGYTQVGDEPPVYDPTTSQDPVWSETDMMQIIVRALALIGVNLQFNTLLGYANDIKNTGQ